MVNLTDTHCHLNFNLFQSDLNETLNRARDAGVETILIPGTDLESSRSALNLSEIHSRLFAAVGVHPNDAQSWNEDTINQLKELAGSPRVVAIGEIGLDYYRDRSPRDLQLSIFQEQLNLASDLSLPVIIHSRNSFMDVWSGLMDWFQKEKKGNTRLASAPGVLHSFEGNLENALQAVSINFFIGVGGPVTFDNAKERQKIIAQIPLENLVLETDAPFLTPHPYRGKRNEPAYIMLIAEKIAQLKNIDLTEVIKITSKNAEKLFGWGLI